jgi:hypothetical protein
MKSTLWALRQGDKVVWAGKEKPTKDDVGNSWYWRDVNCNIIAASYRTDLCRVEVKILK